MLRRRSLISISGKLPSQYQQVEYIESTGTQYIDTGVPMDANDYGVYIDFYQYDMGTSRNWYHPFGSQKASSPYNGLTAECNMGGLPYKGMLLSTNGDPNPNTGYYTPFSVFGVRNKINGNYLNSHIMRWENTNGTYDFASAGQSSANGGYTIYLFAANSAGSVSYPTIMKLYECKISKGSSVIRNFIPCYRKSDSVVGLYDLCTKQFFTNQGTGNFALPSLVPIMTSNTSPSGTVVSGGSSPANAFKVFDGDNTTGADLYHGGVGALSGSWIGYQFTQSTSVKKVSICEHTISMGYTKPYKMLAFDIQYSTNGSDWVTAASYTCNHENGIIYDYDTKTTVSAPYWRIAPTASNDSFKVIFYEIRFLN